MVVGPKGSIHCKFLLHSSSQWFDMHGWSPTNLAVEGPYEVQDLDVACSMQTLLDSGPSHREGSVMP